MKNTSKFLAVMLAITGLFCCAVAVGIGAGFNACLLYTSDAADE